MCRILIVDDDEEIRAVLTPAGHCQVKPRKPPPHLPVNRGVAQKGASVVFHLAQSKLSIVTRDGRVCGVAPVGEPGGPFRISILQFSPDENPAFIGQWPISKTIATHVEAVALLQIGFELDFPPDGFPEPTHTLLSEVMAGGLLRPVVPRRN